jgi:tRNA(fMet)-specific endonuclease VapC
LTHLIDTNIAIHLRDGDEAILQRIDDLPERPFLSIVSQIELEGGVYAKPHLTATRRATLDVLLTSLKVIDFDRALANGYRKILQQRGYSRPAILDRMIAATAIAHDLTLITMNGADFAKIPELKLEIWPSVKG